MVSPMLRLMLLAGSVSGLWSFEEAPAGRPPEGFEVIAMQPPAPRWVVEKHAAERVLAQTEATPEDKKGRHSFAVVKGRAYGDAVLRGRVKLLSENGQAGLVFRYQDRDNHYLIVLDAKRQKIRLVRVVDGNRVSIHGEDDVELETGVWYRLKVRLTGPEIRARIHGLRLFEAKDRSLPHDGRIGFFCDDHTRAHFDDLAVAPIEP
jgi:hypothetical protein